MLIYYDEHYVIDVIKCDVSERSFTETSMTLPLPQAEEEQLEVFRRVRDEIKEWISQTFGR